ncbi:hypothetical protein [Deinococcus soli (ex Cha et al. 2016)]|uniref:Uncharacterized protein n=1 Tax=Deinococcus soli (ex Cha et al. 2016) TaxID=1309411 RepID=A0ACC6KPJ3_9DEIO|nr:hypothetical protein [Deinococcus soli (ex Cha et al. 2016)]MDR6330582.1 hypothetical protein [Deinococcus soli (ex Cha et al. 2016)]MDR6754359.1 hypothetical protein [Deinococcus soli (ex Cha et al. 2016)]
MNDTLYTFGRRIIINALITLPCAADAWDGQPVRVRAADLDIHITVTPAARPAFRAALHAQQADQHRVTLHTHPTGLFIVDASSTPADQLEPHAYLLEAYRLAPEWCDDAARNANRPSWSDLVHGLKFHPHTSGTQDLGLHADGLSLSGIPAGAPTSLANFTVTVRGHHLTVRDGRAA